MRLNQIPGIAAIVIATSSLVFHSCSDQGGSTTPPKPIDRNAPVVFDSIRKLQLDSMAMKINELMNTRGLIAKKIPFHTYDPTDSIGYILTEEHHARISMNTHPDSNIVWPYFWVYNGEVFMMRLRQYSKIDNVRKASETVIYYDQGRIIYCNERIKELGGKEIPGAVQNEPFVKSTRTYGDLEQELKKYWSEATNAMKKENVLPDWIRQ